MDGKRRTNPIFARRTEHLRLLIETTKERVRPLRAQLDQQGWLSDPERDLLLLSESTIKEAEDELHAREITEFSQSL